MLKLSLFRKTFLSLTKGVRMNIRADLMTVSKENTNFLKERSNFYFRMLLAHKVHYKQDMITDATFVKGFNSLELDKHTKDDDKFIEMLSKEISVIRNYLLHGKISLEKNISMFTYASFLLNCLKKFLIKESNLADPRIRKQIFELNDLIKRFVHKNLGTYQATIFTRFKTIIGLMIKLCDNNFHSAVAFNNEMDRILALCKKKDIYMYKSALINLLENAPNLLNSENKDTIINELNNFSVVETKMQSPCPRTKNDVIDDLFRGLTIRQINLPMNVNFRNKAIELILSDTFTNFLNKNMLIFQVDVISRYIYLNKINSHLWKNKQGYKKFILTFYTESLKELKNSMGKKKKELSIIAYSLKSLKGLIDADNEEELNIYKENINYVIQFEKEKSLEYGYNGFLLEILHAMFSFEKNRFEPEIILLLNSLITSREKLDNKNLKAVVDLLFQFFSCQKLYSRQIHKTIYELCSSVSDIILKSKNSYSRSNLNYYSRAIFKIGIDKNKELFNWFSEINSSPKDIFEFIYSLNFWTCFLLECSEFEVSANSEKLSGFLFQIDSIALIDEFFAKNKNNQKQMVILLDKLEKLHHVSTSIQIGANKKSVYRAKPLKRTFEAIFLNIFEKLFDEEEKIYQNFFINKDSLEVFLKILLNVTNIISKYNVKFYETINIKLYDLLVCNRDMFNLEMKCKFYSIIAGQNYHSNFMEFIYKSVFNTIVEDIVENPLYEKRNLEILMRTRCLKIIHSIEGLEIKKFTDVIKKYFMELSLLDDFTLYSAFASTLSTFDISYNKQFCQKIENDIQNDIDTLFKYLNETDDMYFIFSLNELTRLVLKIRHVKKNKFISQDSEDKLQNVLDYIRIKKKDKITQPKSSHVQNQIEMILQRCGIPFEREVYLHFAFQDLVLDGNCIVEIAGNIHLFNGNIDTKLASARKIYEAMGYKYIILFDYEFLQALNKQEFLIKKLMKTGIVEKYVKNTD